MIVTKCEEPALQKALFQFIFPFSLEKDCQDELWAILVQDNYIPFQLDNLKLENRFYGPDNKVSHRDMERYFLPLSQRTLISHLSIATALPGLMAWI